MRLKFEEIVASRTFRRRPKNLLDAGPVERIFLNSFFFSSLFSLSLAHFYLRGRYVRAYMKHGAFLSKRVETNLTRKLSSFRTCTKVSKYARLPNFQPRDTYSLLLNIKE